MKTDKNDEIDRFASITSFVRVKSNCSTFYRTSLRTTQRDRNWLGYEPKLQLL